MLLFLLLFKIAFNTQDCGNALLCLSIVFISDLIFLLFHSFLLLFFYFLLCPCERDALWPPLGCWKGTNKAHYIALHASRSSVMHWSENTQPPSKVSQRWDLCQSQSIVVLADHLPCVHRYTIINSVHSEFELWNQEGNTNSICQILRHIHVYLYVCLVLSFVNAEYF